MFGALALLMIVDPSPLARYSFNEIAMGCGVRIELFAPCEEVAVAAARRAFDRVHALDEVLSDYLPTSEVNRLPRTAHSATEISADLAQAITHALCISRATDGAFDVTTGALSQLWRGARIRKQLPSDDEIAAALAQCGFASLTIEDDPPRLTSRKLAIRLDFGGIGKGFAAQAAVESLRSSGVTSALCAVAGDIACGSAPPQSAGWTIEIAPHLADNARTILHLTNASISTSGDAEQHIEIDGVRHGHIYDPRTGRAVTRRIAASVVSRSGAVADGLATALCVGGMALLDQHARLVEALGPFEWQIVELDRATLEDHSQCDRRAATTTRSAGWKSLQEAPPAPAAVDQTEAKAASGSLDSPPHSPK